MERPIPSKDLLHALVLVGRAEKQRSTSQGKDPGKSPPVLKSLICLGTVVLVRRDVTLRSHQVRHLTSNPSPEHPDSEQEQRHYSSTIAI
jgi:hypothetical protein